MQSVTSSVGLPEMMVKRALTFLGTADLLLVTATASKGMMVLSTCRFVWELGNDGSQPTTGVGGSLMARGLLEAAREFVRVHASQATHTVAGAGEDAAAAAAEAGDNRVVALQVDQMAYVAAYMKEVKTRVPRLHELSQLKSETSATPCEISDH